MRHVLVVADAIGQRHVEVAALLAEGKVGGAVHRAGEDPRVVLEDRSGAVALMHVEVDDGHVPDPPGVDHRDGGHCHVVEDAVAFATIAKRMVGAAGEVG